MVVVPEALTGEWDELWGSVGEKESVVGGVSLWQDGSVLHGTHASAAGAGPTGGCSITGSVAATDVSWTFVEWGTEFRGVIEQHGDVIQGVCTRLSDNDTWAVKFQRKRPLPQLDDYAAPEQLPREPSVHVSPQRPRNPVISPPVRGAPLASPSASTLRLAGVQSRYLNRSGSSTRPRTASPAASARAKSPAASGPRAKSPAARRGPPAASASALARTQRETHSRAISPAPLPQRGRTHASAAGGAGDSPRRLPSVGAGVSGLVVSDAGGGVPLFMKAAATAQTAPAAAAAAAASPPRRAASGTPRARSPSVSCRLMGGGAGGNARGALPESVEYTEMLQMQAYRAAVSTANVKAHKASQIEQGMKQLRMLNALVRRTAETALQKELVADERERREATGLQVVGVAEDVVEQVAQLKARCGSLHRAVVDASTPLTLHEVTVSDPAAATEELAAGADALAPLDAFADSVLPAPRLLETTSDLAAALAETHSEISSLDAFVQSGLLVRCMSLKADLVQRNRAHHMLSDLSDTVDE